MSAKTSTPPQAYTRETLTKAFEWMKTQPASVKDKVTSADVLVRLYLHSKRFGSPTLALLDDRQPNLEDLISVENFKQDLKDLAQGLKQFDEPTTTQNSSSAPEKNVNFSVNLSQTSATVAEPRPSTRKSADSGRMQEQIQTPVTPPPQGPSMNFTPQPPPQMPPSMTWNQQVTNAPIGNPNPQGDALGQGWDEKTYMAVKATKDRFNLSSDHEALRLLVATGFDRLRETFLKGF